MNVIFRSLIAWVTLFILAACTSVPISIDLSKPTETSTPTPAGEVHPTQQPPCPVTPYATGRPPDSHTASFTETWYGNEALWAGLSPAYNGTWYAGSQGLKVLWYRSVAGKLTVEGQRLDAAAPSLQADIPAGYGNSGYQASGLVFPAEGCWEVIGRVAGQALRFVVSVHPAAENPIK